MHSLIQNVLERLRACGQGALLTPEEALTFISLPAAETASMLAAGGLVRDIFHPHVFTCGIINAKSGRCPENCAFCAQSAHHRTGAPVYPLLNVEALLRRAERLVKAGALRFGIVTSGTALNEKELDTLCEAARRIVRETGVRLCGSLGMLTAERAKRLHQAGFSRYHHNLETAASYFDAICSTHAYSEDLDTVSIALNAGMEVCSGGILGMGESRAQRVELALTLADLNVTSIPINLLTAIPGTPLENEPPLSPMEALRCIATYRLLHPSRDILVCGGRGHILKEWQSWLFAAGANGILTGDYLTTAGETFDADNAMLDQLGLPRLRASDCA